MERHTRRSVLAAGAAGLAGTAGCLDLLPGGSGDSGGGGPADYRSFGYGRRSRSYSERASGPGGEVTDRWRVEDAVGIDPPAVVTGGPGEGGTVYCLRGPDPSGETHGADPARLAALSAASGEAVWEYDLAGAVRPSTPAVADGSVYVGDSEGTVHAVDAASGERRWTATLDKSATRTNPVVAGDAVVVGTGTVELFDFGSVYALDTGDGSVRWRADEGRATVRTLAIGGPGDDTVYYPVVGDDAVAVAAVSLSDGSREWETPVEAIGPVVGVCVSDGRVVPAAHGPGPTVLDAGNGEIGWRGDRSTLLRVPAVGGGRAYVVYRPEAGPSGPAIRLASFAVEDGTERWTVDFEDQGPWIPPTVVDGVVYRAVEPDLLAAHDAESGDRLWSYAPAESPTWFGRPAVVDGVVYAPSDRRGLYALEAA